jgi:hypothetical protein
MHLYAHTFTQHYKIYGQKTEFTKIADNMKPSFFDTILITGMTTPECLMSDQVSAVELPTGEARVPQWVYLLS